ncbi:MAG: hypothetical protein ACRC7N_10350, partial [Clostridium sp.]
MGRRKKVNNDAIKYNYDDKGNVIQLEAIESRTVQPDGRIHTNKIMVEGTLAKPKKILSALNPTTMNYEETSGAIAQDNQYKIDYANGDIYFHNSQIGTNIKTQFMYIGEKLSDGSEIYVNKNSDGTINKNLTEEFASISSEMRNCTNIVNETNAIVFELENNKIDKINGKGLSTNDYTNEEQSLVKSIVEKQSILDNSLTTTNKKISGAINELNSEKANSKEVVKKGSGTLNDFDEETRKVLLGLNQGQINAVLGIDNVSAINSNFINKRSIIYNKGKESNKLVNIDGTVVNSSVFSSYLFVELKQGVKYIHISEGSDDESNKLRTLVFYNSSKVKTRALEWVQSNSSFELNDGEKYISFSIKNTNISC